MPSTSDSDLSDLFELLDAVRARPGMYLGWSPEQREAQLRTLQVLVIGYTFALDVHDINECGREFLEAFTRFVHERTGWSMSRGVVEAILDQAKGEEAWSTFWRLFDEFRGPRPAGESP